MISTFKHSHHCCTAREIGQTLPTFLINKRTINLNSWCLLKLTPSNSHWVNSINVNSPVKTLTYIRESLLNHMYTRSRIKQQDGLIMHEDMIYDNNECIQKMFKYFCSLCTVNKLTGHSKWKWLGLWKYICSMIGGITKNITKITQNDELARNTTVHFVRILVHLISEWLVVLVSYRICHNSYYQIHLNNLLVCLLVDLVV